MPVIKKAAINPCTCFGLDVSFQLIFIYTKGMTVELQGKSIFTFVRNCQTVFPSGWILTLNSHLYWMSFCGSSSSPAIGVVRVPNFGHSNRCVMVAHCFNFHSPDSKICGIPFHMLLVHPLWWVVRIFSSFFNQVVSYCWVKSSLYILDNSYLMLPDVIGHLLLDVFFQIHSPKSVTYLLILLQWSFAVFNFNEIQLINDFFQELCLRYCT